MSTKESKSDWIGYRAERLAELFLQELSPSYVAKPTPDLGFDYLVGFPNPLGGISVCAVEVKATEQEIASSFSLSAAVVRRLAFTNIPVLLLVVDVKRNSLHYAWITSEMAEGHDHSRSISIPVVSLDDEGKAELRRTLEEKSRAVIG